MAGDLSKAINSDVCKLTLPVGEIITLFDIEIGESHPRNRRSTRAGKLDTYGPPLQELVASATVDKSIATTIKGYATQNARRAFTKQAVTVTGQNLGGVAGDDLIFTGNAEFHEYRVIAPEGGRDVTIRFNAIFNSDLAITP